jgi:hypothetical protein
MPTIQNNPIDVKWIVVLAGGTTYSGKAAALIGATTLSAGNANAAVQLAQVMEFVAAPNPPLLAQVNLPGAGTPTYVTQLATGTVYYPLETARVAAYALSAANANAVVYVARVLELVTAP